jgi:hypothetical protein
MMDDLIYLAGYYWPYALGALLIGIAAGWFGYPARK